MLPILVVGFFSGCFTKEERKVVKKYYSSGELKSYGYYKDTLPVDTLYNLYEDGNLSSIMVYDSSGYLQGETVFYYHNGNKYQIINYDKGVTNDFFYEFSESGELISKIFFLNDSQIGDSYVFSKGIATVYNFYDFEKHNINFITYDSVYGKIIKDIRQKIFIDSLRPYIDPLDKEHERSYDILLVISNPPKCHSRIKVEYLSKNGVLMKREIITRKSYYFSKERFPDSLFSIKIFGSQYDSLKQKSTYQESIVTLNYEKN